MFTIKGISIQLKLSINTALFCLTVLVDFFCYVCRLSSILICYQCVYLAHGVNDVLDDTLQNYDGSHNFSVRKWILDHNVQ